MYCNFETLYYRKNECIVRCRQCGCYKIAFQHFVVSLPAADYQNLFEEVACRYQTLDHTVPDHQKNIFLPVPSNDLHLILSAGELSSLYNMMEEADTEAQTRRLMQLFQV